MDDRQPTDLSSRDRAVLVEQAVRAPSSHNTQPWRFQYDGNEIRLFADRARALPANDPDDRELTISCGCALLNLRVAAAGLGFRAQLHFPAEFDDGELLATVVLDRTAGSDVSDADLSGAIGDRRTFRKRFDSRPVPPSVLQQLAEAAEREGAWLQVVDSEENRQQVSGLVSEGDRSQWSDPSWRRELAVWMHRRRRGDGLAVPGIVAPIARMVVRSFDMGNVVAARDRKLADESPVLAVLGTRGDESTWLAAGQALQRVLLTACSNGLQASYLNQPIQVASLRPKLQALLGLNGFPQIMLRLGYPTQAIPPTPRRSLKEVIE